jgi:hypothetical protein
MITAYSPQIEGYYFGRNIIGCLFEDNRYYKIDKFYGHLYGYFEKNNISC